MTGTISLPAASVSPDVAIWPHMLPDSWTAEATASFEPLRPHHPTHLCPAGPGNSQGNSRLECCTPNFMPFSSHSPSGAQSAFPGLHSFPLHPTSKIISHLDSSSYPGRQSCPFYRETLRPKGSVAHPQASVTQGTCRVCMAHK